ncbi:MAG: ribosomal RNA small subunit methyltransferase A [Candidatus Omnitrophica bacterium]|nr:ribosomal RNA small subunit methyltransferase A [Candidatus Omnitrophota bacterium]
MSRTANILAKYKLRSKKSLGQHFLCNDEALTRISGISCCANDHVLEIGAGIGNLSINLAKKAFRFYALEKDPHLEPILRETLRDFPNTKLIFKDILQFELKEIFEGKKLKVVGNLPYYITSPIITTLIEQRRYIDTITVTIQKEVAERIVAVPGTKDYGRLSVLAQFYAKTQLIEIFPRYFFLPPPAVDSELVQLKILEKPFIEVKSEKLFFNVVKAAFSQRRKTLLNSLLSNPSIGIKKEILKEILAKINIPSSIRGERLSLEEFAKLAQAISDSSL